jgi:hypothetical protein
MLLVRNAKQQGESQLRRNHTDHSPNLHAHLISDAAKTLTQTAISRSCTRSLTQRALAAGAAHLAMQLQLLPVHGLRLTNETESEESREENTLEIWNRKETNLKTQTCVSSRWPIFVREDQNKGVSRRAGRQGERAQNRQIRLPSSSGEAGELSTKPPLVVGQPIPFSHRLACGVGRQKGTRDSPQSLALGHAERGRSLQYTRPTVSCSRSRVATATASTGPFAPHAATLSRDRRSPAPTSEWDGDPD